MSCLPFSPAATERAEALYSPASAQASDGPAYRGEVLDAVSIFRSLHEKTYTPRDVDAFSIYAELHALEDAMAGSPPIPDALTLMLESLDDFMSTRLTA